MPAIDVPLHGAYHDLESPLQPSRSFDEDSQFEEQLNVEDGLVKTIETERDWNRRRSWWALKDIMTVRSRPRRSVDSGVSTYKHDTSSRIYSSETRRRKNWYNYCVFSGISGFSILAILLLINLTLSLTTLLYTYDPDDVLQKWGGHASGTEGLAWYPTDFTRDIQPIPCHSHNDYWRRVPLFSALRHGCTGVEADVWLFDEELFVGHNTASLTRNRTFSSLYVDPLVRILEGMNQGSEFYNGTGHGVFDVDPGQTLTLLVDVKTGGKETWPWVLKQLQPLRERGWLSFVEDGVVHTRPITVVGTGETPFDVLTHNETYRDAFFDAPLNTMWEPRHSSSSTEPSPSPSPLDEDNIPPPSSGQGLTGTTPTTSFTAQNSYYASVSFPTAIGRMWRGRLSSKQLEIIRGQVRGAHARGLKARYWDLPAWPLGVRNHVWKVLVEEGVDVVNVDDLRGVSRVRW